MFFVVGVGVVFFCILTLIQRNSVLKTNMSLYFKDKSTEKNSTSLISVVIPYVQINLVPFFFSVFIAVSLEEQMVINYLLRRNF